MINLISNHEKGSFLNSCDVVTSPRPFNQLKCVKKLDTINVVLNYFYPSCPFFTFALSIFIKSNKLLMVFFFIYRRVPDSLLCWASMFDCLAKVQHGVNIVLFGRNFFWQIFVNISGKKTGALSRNGKKK